MKRVYFDNSATTQVDREVAQLILLYMTEKYGNPSSLHSFGHEVDKALEIARGNVADLIGAKPSEIYFTSGGTEGDNLAVKGVAWACKHKGNHIVTTAIEHHAILHTCEYLEKNGFVITYLPIDENGVIRMKDLQEAITDETILISVMFANNEVGSLQPIKEIGNLAQEKGIYFHTDAVQVVGNLPLDIKEYSIDLLTLSSHKFYGPKGVGALYVRAGIKMEPLMHGGSQEQSVRAGTENVPGIIGLGKAAEIAKREMADKVMRVSKLRDVIIKNVLEQIPDVKLNGHPEERLPGNVNISFSNVNGKALLQYLNEKGIAASSGSACTSESASPSHVLLALGLTNEEAQGSLRLSLGRNNTQEEADYLLAVLPDIIAKLRSEYTPCTLCKINQ